MSSVGFSLADVTDRTGEPAAVADGVPDLAPYPLPDPAREKLLALAERSDVLFFGEMHGTREVPQLLATLLPELAARGYRGLALELPAPLTDPLVLWSRGESDALPEFFTKPGFDGRGSAETPALIRAAVSAGWELLCFDLPDGAASSEWMERDAAMARNLAEQRAARCPGGKVVALCGNMHSRLHNRYPADSPLHALWPCCAAAFRAVNPDLMVHSVNVTLHGGTFYNVAVRTLGPVGPEAADAEPFVDVDEASGHTLALHLPRGTAASFLAAPETIEEEAGEAKA
jgi:hypothetical protein